MVARRNFGVELSVQQVLFLKVIIPFLLSKSFVYGTKPSRKKRNGNVRWNRRK
jgi:hypothetical protein